MAEAVTATEAVAASGWVAAAMAEAVMATEAVAASGWVAAAMAEAVMATEVVAAWAVPMGVVVRAAVVIRAAMVATLAERTVEVRVEERAEVQGVAMEQKSRCRRRPCCTWVAASDDTCM